MSGKKKKGAAQASRDPGTAEGKPLAKLSMPRLSAGVPRPRLFDLLDDARKRAAVWLKIGRAHV